MSATVKTTWAALAALPYRSIVVDANDDVYYKLRDTRSDPDDYWRTTSWRNYTSSRSIVLPATVLRTGGPQ